MIVEYDCQTCGEHARRKRSPANMKTPPRFCSQACNGANRKGTGVGPSPNHHLKCETCGVEKMVYRSPSATVSPRFCSVECLGTSQAGAGNPSWTGSEWRTRSGYRRGYSFGRATYAHRAAVEQDIGRRLTSQEVVHHINRDRTDNRIENLMLMPNQAAHARLHGQEGRGW